MTAGQLSIFDELRDKSDMLTCPHCHFSWQGIGVATMSGHLEGSNGWPFGASETGKCENQKIYLYRVGAQQHFGLRPQDDEPNTTYKTDMLGVILEAKKRGCTDKQIQKVITVARKSTS